MPNSYNNINNIIFSSFYFSSFFLSCCDESHHMSVSDICIFTIWCNTIRPRDVTLTDWSCFIHGNVRHNLLSIIRSLVMIFCAQLQIFLLSHAGAK